MSLFGKKSINQSQGQNLTRIIVTKANWPARESRRSLNIALDFYVWRCVINAVRCLVSLNVTYSPSSVSLTMTCGPYLKS